MAVKEPLTEEQQNKVAEIAKSYANTLFGLATCDAHLNGIYNDDALCEALAGCISAMTGPTPEEIAAQKAQKEHERIMLNRSMGLPENWKPAEEMTLEEKVDAAMSGGIPHQNVPANASSIPQSSSVISSGVINC